MELRKQIIKKKKSQRGEREKERSLREKEGRKEGKERKL